jgi:hypothetical protein
MALSMEVRSRRHGGESMRSHLENGTLRLIPETTEDSTFIGSLLTSGIIVASVDATHKPIIGFQEDQSREAMLSMSIKPKV